MPARPLTQCNKQGCPHAVRKQGQCPSQCQTKRQQNQYDEHRGNSTQRGYGSRWRKKRAAVLREEPLCRHCLERGETMQSSEVDHIVPKARGGTDERNNLQGLCKTCHSRKTAQQDGGFGHRRGAGQISGAFPG